MMQSPRSRALSFLRMTGLWLILILIGSVATPATQTNIAAAAPALQQAPTFSKSFTPATIGLGSVSTLEFEIVNTSSSGVLDLAFTDTLPAGVLIASPANATSNCSGGSGRGSGGGLTAPDGGTTISFSGGQLAGNSSCTISVNVTSSTLGTHSNVSSNLTSSAGTSGPASADLTVSTDRPGFTKSFTPNSIPLNGKSTLTLTIDNSANPAQASFLTFTDNLPSGMVIADPAVASTTCTGGVLTATPGATTISYASGSVAASTSCAVTVDVLATGSGLLGNTTGDLTSYPSVNSGKAAATLDVTADELALAKSFTDDPVAPGDTVTLEFSITNYNRSNPATNISFSDNLGVALAGLAATGSLPVTPCGAGSQLTGTTTLTLTGGTLAGGESCTFEVTLQVPTSATPGTYLNTTSAVTGDIGRTGVTGSPATDDLFVQPVPRLTKTFTDDPVIPGGTATLGFTITNTSPTSVASNITFTDDLTAMLPGVVATGLPATDVCGVGSQMTGTSTLIFTGGSLDPGASCSFSVTLHVPESVQGGTYTNTSSDISATVGGETLTGNPATDDLLLVSAPRLTKSFTDDTVRPGETVTLEFTLSYNENAPDSASGITFTDNLDAMLPGLTADGLPATDVCGAGSQVSGTSTLSLTGGSLTPNSSCTFSVAVQVPASATAGSYTNTTSDVTATSLGMPTVSAPASDDLTVVGLSLDKVFIDDPTIAGGTTTLEFTLENASATASATNISFADSLDAALPGLTADGLPADGFCGAGSQVSGTSLLTFTGGSLGPGESCTFSVTLQVPTGASAGEYNNVTSQVSADFGGSPILAEGAADTLTVNEALLLSKSFTDDPAAPGDTVTLEFTLENGSANAAATGVMFSDDLDAALSGLTAVGLPADGFCGAGSQIGGAGLLTVTGANLAPGGTCTFSVTLQVPAAATLGTTATNTTSQVSGSIGGIGVTGAPATDDLQITALAFDKSFDGPTTATGTPTLTFTIENLDESTDAANLTFSDDLGAVMPGLVATGLPANQICGNRSQLTGTSVLTLYNGYLGPGESCTFDVTLQVPADASPGSYHNTTSDLFQAGGAAAAPAVGTLAVEPPPAFSKSFAPTPIIEGDLSTLTFTIDNTASTLAATALAFTDNLPAGTVVASPPGASTTCTGGTVTAVAGSGVINYSGGTVPAAASCTLQVDVTGITPGTHVNTTGDLTSSAGNSGTASDTLTVEPKPDVEFSIAGYSVNEADNSATVTVTLSSVSIVDTTVTYTSSDGTASAGNDYTAVSDTLTIPAGQISGTLTVPVLGDTLHEADETLTLTLETPINAYLGSTNPATLTITDDDPAPVVTFSAASYDVGEEDGSATITTTLNVVSGLDAAVDYASSDDTASAGADYTAVSGTLTIPAGQTTTTFTVPVLGDEVDESDETVQLDLASPTNAVLGTPDSATLAIADDDTAGVMIAPTSGLTTTEAGLTDTYTITLQSAPTDTVTITIGTDGQATVTPSRLTFDSTKWDSPQGVTVGAVDDAVVEGTHTSTITHTVTSVDPAYDGVGIADVSATISDNDFRTYLPLGVNPPGLPDLIIRDLVVTSDSVAVTIENTGDAPVVDPFWVDIYIDPTPAPTRTNETWPMLAEQGLVWGITQTALPLDPGETLTLTIGDTYYVPGKSAFAGTIAAGTSLYAQVDSANAETEYGAVLETHEQHAGTYNNIAGPVTPDSPMAVAAPEATTTSKTRPPAALPERRAR